MKKTLLFSAIFISFLQLRAQVQIQMDQPAQTGTFTGNVRGYWFQSPTCFTITGAEIPTDASTGTQNIAIVRFETVPPLYSTTTDNFELLFLTQNDTTQGIIPLNIIIQEGDVIGVLASRNTVSSYSSTGPYTSYINGLPVTLSRLGMQFPLTTTAPQQLWTENAANISRCWLYYDTTVTYSLNYTNTGADYTFTNSSDTMYSNIYSVWDYGDGTPLDTVYSPTHTYTQNGIYTVCTYINTLCGIDTLCQTVTVCEYAISGGFTYNTSGLTAIFTDTSSFFSDIFWDFGDGNTDSVQNPMHTYTAIGTYLVTQIISDDCGHADTISDSVIVCVDPLAGFSYTANMGDVSFTNNSDYTQGQAWDFGDGNNSTNSSPSHLYTNDGTYTVCLTVNNFCGSDTICQQITVNTSLAGMETEETSSGMTVYPNPASGHAFITLQCAAPTGGRLYLTDISGKILENIYNGQFITGTVTVSLNLSTFPSGIYFLKWDTDGFTRTEKLIIQK